VRASIHVDVDTDEVFVHDAVGLDIDIDVVVGYGESEYSKDVDGESEYSKDVDVDVDVDSDSDSDSDDYVAPSVELDGFYGYDYSSRKELYMVKIWTNIDVGRHHFATSAALRELGEAKTIADLEALRGYLKVWC